MPDGATSVRGPRVVILSRDAVPGGAPAAETCLPQARCLRFSSVYEAAAEILAGAADVLVLDPRMLTGRNMRLLEIARFRNVEVMGVGALPSGVSTERLSGLRLVARCDLAAALAKPAAPSAASGGVQLAPAKVRPPAEAVQALPETPDRMEEAPPRAEQELQALLTPEEITALLEDEL